MKILVIQSATIQHIPAIVTLDRLCFGGLWTEEGYRREINSPNSDLLLLGVGEEESKGFPKQQQIIGLGCMWSIVEEAHITLLGIHPDYRRSGLGKLLLIQLFQQAVTRKLERVTLEVRAANQEAISLYESLGFRIAGRRKKYYPKTGEDALILWRRGLDQPEFVRDLACWQQQNGTRLKDRYCLIDDCY